MGIYIEETKAVFEYYNWVCCLLTESVIDYSSCFDQFEIVSIISNMLSTTLTKVLHIIPMSESVPVAIN